MLHPLLKWAQRKEKVFVEVPLRDISNEQINLTGTSLKFKGKSDSTDYAFDIELFEEVNPQDSKWTKTGFHLFFVLQKKDPSKPFWTRLVKSAVKNKDIQVDWNKWVDQDEEQEQGDKGLSGFDPSQMQNFGGMPGMGGMGGMGMPGMGGMGGMGMPGMGGMGMPGMGGMGMPGMGGFGQDQQGNIDDLEGEQEIEEGQKKQGVEATETTEKAEKAQQK